MFNTSRTGLRETVLKVTVGVRKGPDYPMVECEWPITITTLNKTMPYLTTEVVDAAIRYITDTPELTLVAGTGSFTELEGLREILKDVFWSWRQGRPEGFIYGHSGTYASLTVCAEKAVLR